MNIRRHSKFLVGFVTSLILLSTLVSPAKGAVNQSTGQAKAVNTAQMLQFSAGGYALGFTAEGMYAATGSHALHVNYIGVNSVTPQADSPAGADGKATPLGQVTYPDLWDGISLTYTAGAGTIYTTTYTLTPGANPVDIRLHYNVPLSLNKDGNLGITFQTGAMTESAPLAWQEIKGRRVPVEASFRVHGQETGFSLGDYNPGYDLTIDPGLTWNTFLGGGEEDDGTSIAVDGSGNVYVTGESESTWGSPVRPYSGDYYDAFVAKLDSSGELTWNTFLGGSGNDGGSGIAVDGNGNAYVTGYSKAAWSCSPTACTMRAYTGIEDAFAARLTSSGVLTWNTFLGGSDYNSGTGIAVDGNGNAYVTGSSEAAWSCSPTACTMRAYTGKDDAFAARLTSSGVLTWNTFLGGSDYDEGSGIAVDGSGNVYVSGDSDASWGNPVRGFSGGDVFAAKLTASGGLIWNTFLGGWSFDEGSGIAVDGSGNVYVAGCSWESWGNPVRPFTPAGGDACADAFAVKLDSSGALTWNTFLGGSDYDFGYGIAVDGKGNIYVAGESYSSWGCSPAACTVRAYSGDADAFVARLTSSGGLTWNTFLGGSDWDSGSGIAVDGSGNVYVAGESYSSWGSPVRPGYYIDAFAVKFNYGPPAPTNLQASDGTYTDKVRVSWNASSGATVYKVYRADSAAGTKSFLRIVTGTTFDDTYATSGVTYYYWGKACANGNCSDYSGYDTGWRKLSPPTNLQASDGTYTTKVLVSWTASSGATFYKVYRATSSTGTKSLLGSPTGTTFNDTSAIPGYTYRYWVVAYRGTRYSGYSVSDTGWRKLSPPTNLQASDGTYTTQVLVSWTASSGATSYKVYRAIGATGTKTLLGSPTGTTFNDTSATPGVRYYYWVVAYRGSHYSAYSAPNSGWRMK